MQQRRFAMPLIDAASRHRPSATRLQRATSLLVSTLLACTIAVPAVASSAPDAATSVPISTASATTSTTTTTTASMTTSQTAAAMASTLLSWINRDRAAMGLRIYRAWPKLAAVANQRSASMASRLTLSHTAAGGDPGRALTAAGIQWYSYGEIIGESSYTFGSASAANLYAMWKASPAHHAIMFSATYNYIGVGIARAANGTTWSSILFTESVDHTPAIARNGVILASGTTVRLSWSGYDPLLQTHTAGLRGFNVLYRVDSGTWQLIRSNITWTSLSLYNRARHHYYSFRIQAADRRGNLSSWTPVMRIWLP